MDSNFMKWVVRRARAGKPWLFSRIMQEVIPFNRAHRISVTHISTAGCKVYLPHRRRNRNHLGTMHATAIATAAEFVSGLNVLEVFDMAGYRLIMSRLEVDYLRRPIGHCYAESKWDEPTLNAVRQDINDEGVSSFVLKSIVTDSKNEKIAEATIHWQVKSWKKVRVK